MDSFFNMSVGFDTTVEDCLQSEPQLQVWPCGMQTYSNTSDQKVYAGERLNEYSSESDWDSYLLNSRSAQVTLSPTHSTKLVESSVGKVKPPKKHYAHISFVSSVNGLKPVVSRKRKRTAFTTDQVMALEQVFQSKPYVTREERSVLVQRLAIEDQAVKVWFQNRRLKQKKEYEEELEARAYSEDMFAHTELLLKQANNYGCVELNQQSIDELACAIDAYLPQNLDLGQLLSSVEEAEESCSSDSIHEPISPPEVGATEELSSSSQEWWNLEVIDPKQSLQRLLDVHRSL